MQHALFLSPHSNDAAFACGGTMLRLLHLHWKVTLVTLFATPTHGRSDSFHSSTESATSETDPAVRGSSQIKEDESFTRIVGVRDCRWWGFPEASLRGYESVEQQLKGITQSDTIWLPISIRLCEIQAELHPDAVFAPQGLGGQVDRLQTILALRAAGTLSAKTHWYKDISHAVNCPDPSPSSLLPADMKHECVGLKEMDLERKILGCCACPSHLGTAFEVGHKLRTFHHSEAQHLGEGQLERYAECFLTPNELPPLF